jgi:peptidoglycan-associated lipoprotein
MRRAARLLGLVAVASGTAASAQLRAPPIVQRIIPGTRPQPAPVIGVDALRADFIARSGSELVYFAGDGAMLSPAARATLAAQAQWLRLHPEVVVRIEGHAELSDTRDHALAVGVRRAQEVRDYLVLLGVPAAQLSVTSWGKERPGPARAQTILVR